MPCIFASHEVLPYIEYAYHAFYFCNRIVGGIVSFVRLGRKVYEVTILFDSVVCRIEFVANIFNVFCIIEVDSFIPNIFFLPKLSSHHLALPPLYCQSLATECVPLYWLHGFLQEYRFLCDRHHKVYHGLA